jgi:hypothetical protein
LHIAVPTAPARFSGVKLRFDGGVPDSVGLMLNSAATSSDSTGGELRQAEAEVAPYHRHHCDTPGFQPGLLTLMSRSIALTLVKQRSTWAITSKTSPKNPNDTLWSTLINLWSKPYSKPLEHPFAL